MLIFHKLSFSTTEFWCLRIKMLLVHCNMKCSPVIRNDEIKKYYEITAAFQGYLFLF